MLLLCFLFMQLQLPQVYAGSLPQDDEVLLTEAIQAIGRKYQVLFSYDRGFVKEVRVDYDEDATDNLEDALKSILSQTDLKYQIFDQRYVAVYRDSDEGLASLQKMIEHFQGIVDQRQKIRKRKVNSLTPLTTYSAQEIYNKRLVINVSGIVTSASGEPLIGVNVLVKGTDKGTATDFDGRFMIEDVDEQAILIISYIGYQSKEIAVNGKSDITIVLQEDLQTLDEVVVVGYGTQKKSDLTNSVATIKGTDLNSRTVPRIDQAIIGKLAGVSVRENSGAAGSAPVVRIRGYSSLNAGNNPLWVIDGMPVDGNSLANLNFNDVESIEVLKDASAAAIYGSRGSNGVIIVTTKKGKIGESKISFSTFYGLQEPEKVPDLMNSAEWADFVKSARNDGWIQNGGNVTDGNDIRPGIGWDIDPAWENPESLPSYNYYDHLFRNGFTQNYQMSASGGSEKVQYYISGDYRNVNGLVRNNDFERYSFRANVDAQLTDFIKTGISFSPSYSIQNGVRESKGGIFWIAQAATPIVKPGDGIYGSEVATYPYAGGDTYFFERFFYESDINHHSNFMGNLYTEFQITSDLKFKVSFNSSYFQRQRDNFLSIKRLNGNSPIENFSENKSLNFVTDYILSYNKTFNKHSIGITGAYSYQKDDNFSTSISGTGFPNDLITTLNAAGTITSASTVQSQWSVVSYLGRFNYNFENKYLFSGSIRNDGSSRFGGNSKWGLFPSLSAGWRISEEPFLSSVDFIDALKIRASWGKTGNNNIGNYSWQGVLGYSTSLIGTNESQWVGLGPLSIPNPDLTWEKTKSTNIGFDLGIFKSRISLSIDYYNNITDDLLQNVPAPYSSGFTSVLQNVGSVLNKGVELELTSRNITGQFEWITSFNSSFNKNEVLKLGDEGTPILLGPWWASNSSITEIGGPLGGLYFLISDGVYNTQEEIDASPSWPGSRPGDIIIRDANGDGKIDNNDKVVVGQPLPTYYFGITNEFRYKNFELSFLIHGAGGNKIFNGAWRNQASPNTGDNKYAFMTDYWRSPDNPGNGQIPRPSVNPTGASTFPTTRDIYDGDFIRLKNVNFGYSFPSQLLDQIFLKGLRIYVTGENLFLLDKYEAGSNPEPDIDNGTATIGGFDYGTYPLARQLVFGINLTF